MGEMQLDHERLDVYDLALEFLVLANKIIEGLPREPRRLIPSRSDNVRVP